MAEPDDGPSQGRAPVEGRPSASSLIAELWSEREQSISAAPAAAPPGRSGRPSRPPRDGSDGGKGRTGLVAAVVALGLLLGAGVGVFMATQGVGMASTAKYAAKADDVCGQANGIVAIVGKPTSYPDLASAAGALAGATDAQMGRLGKIARPGGTAGGHVGALLTAMTEAGAASRSLQEAAGRKDDAATAAATRRVGTAASEASAKARVLGFKACGVGMQDDAERIVGGATGIVKTAFVAKADTLCRATARSMEAIAEPRNDMRDIARFLGQSVTFVERLMVDLRATPVPPGDETALGDALAAQDKVVAKAKEARDAALGGDRSRFVAIDVEITTLSTAADAKLDAYGLTVCGSNFGGR